jgi:hypothetical protein
MLLTRWVGLGLAAAVKVMLAEPIPLAAEVMVIQGSVSETVHEPVDPVTIPNGVTPLPSALTLPVPGFAEYVQGGGLVTVSVTGIARIQTRNLATGWRRRLSISRRLLAD